MSDSLQPHELQHARFPCPSTVSLILLRFKSAESGMLSSLPSSVTPFSSCHSVFPSIRVFSSESAFSIRWPKYWSFSFSISPASDYSGFISFRIDWFDLLGVQGTLKSLLQHHSLKVSVLRHSTFFLVHLSHPNMTTRKKHSFDYMDLHAQQGPAIGNQGTRLLIQLCGAAEKHVPATSVRFSSFQPLSRVRFFGTP